MFGIIGLIMLPLVVLAMISNLIGRAEMERFKSGKWIPSDRKYRKLVDKRREQEFNLARS